MNFKKILYILLPLLIICGISWGLYYYVTGTDSNSLTLTEKEWIDSNKNDVFDFSIVNNIPIFSKDGSGVIFDFLDNLEKDTKLEFNRTSYQYGTGLKSDYSFTIKDKKEKNDIVLYEDTYSLISKDGSRYNSTADIQNIVIGVQTDNLDKIQKYLEGSSNIVYKTFNTESELLTELTNPDSSLNAVVLPKTIYMDKILSDNKLTISYNITEMSKKYVITLGDEDYLNSILQKYFNKYKSERLKQVFNEYLASNYYELAKVTDKEKTSFTGKRYSYGFIDNIPFDTLVNGKFVGINTSFLRDFSKLANIEISFKKYDSIDSLLTDFNNNKIDFFFGNNATTKYNLSTYKTVSNIDEQIVILSDGKNNITVNNLSSLANKKVVTIKSSMISEVLKENNVKIVEYKDIKTLLKKKKNNDILALDLDSYNYYKDKLSNFKVNYQFSLGNDYTFVLNDSNENKVFNRFLNFYLSYVNEKEVINNAYLEIDKVINKPSITKIIVYIISIGFIFFFAIFGVYKFTNRDKKIKPITKGDKLKYIDAMTSLKNRNYLNDSIERWDDSEIYPQAIVIVDLNNINYINDNYGHEEGDNVIKQAANILIKNQIENSEIVRTNGDEFLVYLVGYTEKQVISYIKKLHKELKSLEHGFGACTGYSMIMNGIKTVDDAINEATSEMKREKKELKDSNGQSNI